MIRFLIYALIASEFAATGGWHAYQWKLHKKRRAGDLMYAVTFMLLALSYFAYGAERLFFKVASPAGYVADALVACTLGFFCIRRIKLGLKVDKASKATCPDRSDTPTK